MVKKIFGYIVIICLFAGSIAGIYFGIRFAQVSKELKSDSEYIEQIDYLELELSQVNKSLTEANNKYSLLVAENEQNKQTIADYSVSIEEKNSQIQSLEGNISELQGQISTMNGQISTLETEKADLLAQIEDLNEEHLAAVQELESQIETLEGQVSTLTNSVNSLQGQVETLTSEKNDLLLDIETLEAKVSANETIIVQYESQILTLQNEVTRLTGLLEGYEDIKNGTFEVNFYLKLSTGDLLYKTFVVRNGNFVETFGDPEKTDTYEFLYWTLDGETEVDPFTTPIIDDTCFYGVVLETKVGLYDSTSGRLLKSWDELIEENYLEIYNSDLRVGTNYENLPLLTGSLYLPDDLFTSIHSNTFRNCLFDYIYIPNSVTVIYAAAFKNCVNLAKIELPDNVQFYGGLQFSGCVSLHSIYMPSSLTYRASVPADECAFLNCASDFVIYTDALEQPDSWTRYFNVIQIDEDGDYVLSSVKYGYTYEEYLEEISILNEA